MPSHSHFGAPTITGININARELGVWFYKGVNFVPGFYRVSTRYNSRAPGGGGYLRGLFPRHRYLPARLLAPRFSSSLSAAVVSSLELVKGTGGYNELGFLRRDRRVERMGQTCGVSDLNLALVS